MEEEGRADLTGKPGIPGPVAAVVLEPGLDLQVPPQSLLLPLRGGALEMTTREPRHQLLNLLTS